MALNIYSVRRPYDDGSGDYTDNSFLPPREGAPNDIIAPVTVPMRPGRLGGEVFGMPVQRQVPSWADIQTEAGANAYDPFNNVDFNAQSPVNEPAAAAESPKKTKREELIEKYFRDKDAPVVQKTKNPFLNILKGIGLNALKDYAKTGNIWGALGAGAAGGVVTGFDPTYEDRLAKDRNLAREQQDIAYATKLEGDTANIAGKEATAAYTAQRPVIETTKLGQGQQKINESVRSNQADEQIKSAKLEYDKLNNSAKNALSAIGKQGYYKKGENPALDKALGTNAVSDFDDRYEYKPQNGIYYQINKQTGESKPIQGVPPDLSQSLTQITIGGKTLIVKQSQAGNILAGNFRQEQQQNFQAGQNEANRNLSREQAAERMKVMRENGTLRLSELKARLAQQVSNGQLDQDTADQIWKDANAQ